MFAAAKKKTNEAEVKTRRENPQSSVSGVILEYR